jgi:hypothetical protein
LEHEACGIVYKDLFPYGTIVTVKRLKGHVSAVGDTIKMCAKCMSVPSEKIVSVPSAKKHSEHDTQYMFLRYNFHLYLAYAKHLVHCTFYLSVCKTH